MFFRSAWVDRVEAAWRQRPLVWLLGVRRVGKTVLAKSLPDIQYFDCELPRHRRQLEDPEGFLAQMTGKRVVLDEVQRLTDPSELLKIAADHYPSVRVLATGSSTFDATSKFRDSLTGRKSDVWLTPMNERDLRDFGGAPLRDRLARGGLPPFFLGEVPEADYQAWIDSYWARDVQELFRLERRASFVRFLELVLARSGGLFEASSFAAECEVSRTTIANYLGVLEMTKVAHVVRPFSTRRATEIVSMPKVYGFDTGFVTSFKGLGDPRDDDLGPLWEHYVLNELHSHALGAHVRHWRTTHHQEVDFVIARPGAAPIAIECKWSVDGREDVRGLKAFRRVYPQGETFVVSSDVDRSFTRDLGPAVVHYVSLGTLVERLTST